MTEKCRVWSWLRYGLACLVLAVLFVLWAWDCAVRMSNDDRCPECGAYLGSAE